MSKISSTKRVLEILNDLNNGKTLCIEALSYIYNTSTRSIRRDFELIKELYGDILISTSKGCYSTVTKSLLADALTSTELYMLKNILQLSEESSLSLGKDIDKETRLSILKQDSVQNIYKFKHKPYEDIYTQKEKFKILEHAVKYRKEVKIIYNNGKRLKPFVVSPYKIVFINENFYLASAREHYDYVLSRIALIEEVTFTGKQFLHNHNLLNFIEHIQTPWAVYSQDWQSSMIEVILQIPEKLAKYFRLKKFLPSQEIISEDENGDITLRYMVTSVFEVDALIKQWIPYIKIIAPLELKETFLEVAKVYYANSKQW